MKILKRTSNFLKRLFTLKVIVTGMESRWDDNCKVTCINRKCALHHPEGFYCVCKQILLDENGKCRAFIPKDGKNGEFPL